MANILQKISAVVKKYMTYGEVTLQDGTKLMVSTETPEVGSDVMVVTENGEEMAPAGEHTLSDGTVINVDELGKIVEISTTEEESSEEEPDLEVEVSAEGENVIDPTEVDAVVSEVAPELETEKVMQITDSVLAILDEKLASMNTSMETKFSEILDLMKEMGKSQVEFTEELTSLKKTPNGTPVSQMEFKEETNMDPLTAKLEYIKTLRQK